MKRLSQKIILALCCFAFSTAMVFADTRKTNEYFLSSFQEEVTTYEPHLQALWVSRLENSTTILLALQKLNEKTGNIKAKDKVRFRQRILQSAVSLGSLGASAFTGSSAPLVGGNMLSSIAGPNNFKAYLENVSNADMVLLARAVEEEQAGLMKQYLELRQALEEKKLIEAQMNEALALGESLPQADSLKVAQFMALNQLMAQKQSAASSRVEVAKNVLEQSTNPSVVADIERDLLGAKVEDDGTQATPELDNSKAEEVLFQ